MGQWMSSYREPMLRYGLGIVTAPSVEPIDIATAKLYLRVETDDDVTLIQAMIQKARVDAENKLDRTLINTTWRMTFDEFPCGANPIHLPRPPLGSSSSNVSITYTNSTGASTVWDSSNYSIDYNSEPGRLFPIYGQTWPTARDIPNAVTIQFVAGYGATADTVPAGIRTYMMRLIADEYENREVSSVGMTVNPHSNIEGLLDPYRWTVHVS